MRVNLNLNKYYEDLELEDINYIWSSMLDMKPNIDGLDFIYNESEERFEQTDRWKRAKRIGEVSLGIQLKYLEKYMNALGKESIFNIKEWECKDIDYDAVIKKYRFLMSEPSCE